VSFACCVQTSLIWVKELLDSAFVPHYRNVDRTIIWELPLWRVYQLPILTMVNMIEGMLGSSDGAILRRPQP
jgi:hypothetical protein